MYNNFNKLFYLLTKQEKKKAYILLVMILLMAFIDMVGVASILPFIAVLTNPSLIETNFFLGEAYQLANFYGLENKNQFFFLLGIIVFVLLIFSLIVKAITNYARLRFTLMQEYSIAKRLTEHYLNQPYEWFLDRHSADLGKTILSEVTAVAGQGIQPMINLIAQASVSFALFALLILVDYKIAILTSIILLSSYFIIYKLSKNFLYKIGKERFKANKDRFNVLSEVFRSPKEIKLNRLEFYFLNKFAYPAKTFARHQSSSQAIGQLPRFFIEAVAFGGMLIVILYLIKSSGSFNNALPVMALYAYAGYRIMPAIQQIYLALTQLRYVGPSLESVHNDFKNLETKNILEKNEILSLKKNIILKNIYYRYPNTSRFALKNINLEIPAKTTVGIMGETGSGKTTLVDIILGLLKLHRGAFIVDGKYINQNNVKSLQSLIGYVPQNIYLSDDTVEANIAFGIAKDKIDNKAVIQASKIANLHNFVSKELPQNYKTTIGEGGVRLSGGQRQRIGIARALYHKPKILILDEATSALDNLTEEKVMKEIYKLSREITIIIIAHRLSTLKNCDSLFYLNSGTIINQGNFNDFIKKNPTFNFNNKNS